MSLILSDIDASAWKTLETAAESPQSGFRFLNLCSVDAEAKPQARTMVLRRVDKPSRVLEFHTDMRSSKWLELSENPHVTVLGFCAQTRLQLRLQGVAAVHSPGSEVANHAWKSLPVRTRQIYMGGPPGDEFVFDASDEVAPSEALHKKDGKAHFGVVIFRSETLDWFQLRRQSNRRARFAYSASGVLADSQWINP